jgi:hypothetical protein
VQWFNDAGFAGDYQNFPVQTSKVQLEKRILEQRLYQTECVDFVIEKMKYNYSVNAVLG